MNDVRNLPGFPRRMLGEASGVVPECVAQASAAAVTPSDVHIELVKLLLREISKELDNSGREPVAFLEPDIHVN